MTASPFRFYAAEISYFSAKVRPALRYKGVHYLELAPDYRNVILPRTGLAFIPIVITPEDDTWQDTSDDPRRARARASRRRRSIRRRRCSGSPRTCSSSTPTSSCCCRRCTIAGAFPRASPRRAPTSPPSPPSPRPPPASPSGCAARCPSSASRPASVAAIEAHLHDLLERLSAHFAVHPFLLGDRMSLADCALMGPLYAHLYLDAVPGRLLRESAPAVCHWIERMNRPDPRRRRRMAPDDALAPTLRPLLALIGQDAVPFFLGRRAGLRGLGRRRPGGDRRAAARARRPRNPLRGVGPALYQLVYALDAAAPARRRIGASTPPERAAVDAAFAGTGCEVLLAFRPRHRVGKRGFKLVLAGC